MSLTTKLAALALIVPLTACATTAADRPETIGAATLSDAAGKQIGTAVLTAADGQVTLAIRVSGLTPQQRHGIHLHAVGACDGPAFASAGPHLNPTARQHGLANPAGAHLGDLPNLVIDSQGQARLSADLPGAQAAIRSQLFDNDGTALVLHAQADDLRTDPSGNSGNRIACGILRQSKR